MNETAVKLWIEALRSGRYKQTRGALHDANGYCCLGVACELYQKKVGDLKVDIRQGGAYSYDNESGVLPPKVMNWLRLNSDDGSFDHYSLAARNDDGTTFEKIADIIESNPEGLFIDE